MSNSVAPRRGAKGRPAPAASSAGLYTARGARKYLTRSERQRAMQAMARDDSDAGLMALTLAWTGARVSEVLALTAEAFQVEAGLVAIVTLKRRKPVVREVPIPRALMTALDARFGLTAARSGCEPASRLWPCRRETAWRRIKAFMEEAGISGRPACPRGLRHAFGTGTLQSGVPLTLVQRWLGHARLTTTAIYAEVSGPEEAEFAASYWQWSEEARYVQAA